MNEYILEIPVSIRMADGSTLRGPSSSTIEIRVEALTGARAVEKVGDVIQNALDTFFTNEPSRKS
jgi:hypothetical protein